MASGHVHTDGRSEGVTLPGSVPGSTVGPRAGTDQPDVVGPPARRPESIGEHGQEVAPEGFDPRIDEARARMPGQQLGAGEG